MFSECFFRFRRAKFIKLILIYSSRYQSIMLENIVCEIHFQKQNFQKNLKKTAAPIRKSNRACSIRRRWTNRRTPVYRIQSIAINRCRARGQVAVDARQRRCVEGEKVPRVEVRGSWEGALLILNIMLRTTFTRSTFARRTRTIDPMIWKQWARRRVASKLLKF